MYSLKRSSCACLFAFASASLCCLSSVFAAAASRPWQEITVPTVAEAATLFANPPAEYRAIHWAIWGGQQTRERILADIERLHANGAGVYMINHSRGMQPAYFTPEYLDLVKFVVEQCKQRSMKVWIEDDAGYPSGFAGGLISRDYPELAMQAIVADARYTVAAGQTLRIPLPPDTLGILAFTRGSRTVTVLPLPENGQFEWTAPNPGMSEVLFARHVFRSSPTRFTNRADGTNDKDSLYSLIDYLNPEATRVYLKLVHETYEKLVGDEFGKTVLGFRGDEPDYTGFMPWSPLLLETFRKMKGYDLQPYIVRFFAPELPPDVVRAKADYWDVWSAMFRDHFYKLQDEWCRARGMEYMTHLNHEEVMLDLARGEDLIRNQGDFFRNMRYTGVPGVDNLSQIRPGVVADFPKLAASAAHLYGRPHAWTEAGGSLAQSGKFVADYQLVRGINYLNVRAMNTQTGANASLLSDPAAAIAHYVNRAGFLLSIGRPAAQVALFHPTDSMWLGDDEADEVTVRLTTQLMEHQIDFDHVDQDALASLLTLEGGGFKNLSGQIYRAVIIPSSSVINRAILERLRAFAEAGGKVIFVGRTPTLVADKSFLHAEERAPDLSFATLEPTPELTARVIAALPQPDVKLDSPCPPIKYIRRSLRDGQVYFFFNESDQRQTRTATLAGNGQVQVWDPNTGTVHPLRGATSASGSATVPLALEPYETRFIVIGQIPGTASTPMASAARSQTLADLGGNWSIILGERRANTTLQSWEELGVAAFAGIAEYRKEFTLPASRPAGQRVYLDLGIVREIARVRVNGTDLGIAHWPPYRWDVTDIIKSGTNTLEVQVQVPPGGLQRGGAGARGGAAVAGAGAGGQRGGPGATQGPAAGATTAAVTPATTGGLSPTGVPGGLRYEEPSRGGGGGRGGRGGANANEAPPASGLLGPVRLIAE